MDNKPTIFSCCKLKNEMRIGPIIPPKFRIENNELDQKDRSSTLLIFKVNVSPKIYISHAANEKIVPRIAQIIGSKVNDAKKNVTPRTNKEKLNLIWG